MSKTFSKIKMTADNGSVDEFLWSNSVGTKDELEYTDGYQNFIEDNPDNSKRICTTYFFNIGMSA